MDQQLLFLINRAWTSPVLDRVMAGITSFDVWAPFMVLAALGLLWKGDFRARAFVVVAGAIVGITDGAISAPLKRAVDRPRPHQTVNDVRVVELAKVKPRLVALGKPVKVKLSRVTLGEVEGRSFPSSHTMNTWAAALVGLAFYGRRAAWGFLVAGLVAYSRIYTGSHWPSDVLVSIMLATGSTLLLLALTERLWQRAGRRWCPALQMRHPTLLAS